MLFVGTCRLGHSVAIPVKPTCSKRGYKQVTRCHDTQARVSVDDLYNKWRTKYLVQIGNGRKYANFQDRFSQPPEAVTTSESIGYGMLISVLKNQNDDSKNDFDGLWAFYKSFVNENHGMMKWQILKNSNGALSPRDPNSATDGDMDVAYALFKAEEKWPTSDGKYRNGAQGICKSLLTHCIKSGESHMPMVGSWAGPTNNRVLSRSSDWMPGHFRLFKKEDVSGHADQWQATFDKTVAAYARNLSQQNTGLLADFYVYDEGNKVYNPARGWVLETDHDGDYHTNASRVPWRLAAYLKAEGGHADAALVSAMEALKRFFEKEVHDRGEVKGGYKLSDGTPLNNGTTNFFLGPAWRLLKMMGSSNEILDRLEQRVHDKLYETYFADSIVLLSILETQ